MTHPESTKTDTTTTLAMVALDLAVACGRQGLPVISITIEHGFDRVSVQLHDHSAVGRLAEYLRFTTDPTITTYEGSQHLTIQDRHHGTNVRIVAVEFGYLAAVSA